MKKTNRLSLLAACALAALMVGCADEMPKHLQPLSYQAQMKLKLSGLSEDAPIMLRIFKEESELEVWKQSQDGTYKLVTAYPICKWSGELGPKQKEGDHQAPEGFYAIRPVQMNPWSKYYLSFNIGYPNAYDKAHERTGSYLMVHGACSSAGCYSMTDEYIADIYAFAREAFDGGQPEFQIQAFPFRMSEENLERHKDQSWYPFWQNLKEGYDAFEVAKVPPKIDVCGRHYVFNASFEVADNRIDPSAPCPPLVPGYAPSGREPQFIARAPAQPGDASLAAIQAPAPRQGGYTLASYPATAGAPGAATAPLPAPRPGTAVELGGAPATPAPARETVLAPRLNAGDSGQVLAR